MEQTVVKSKWLLNKDGKVIKDAMVIFEDQKFDYVGEYNSHNIQRGSTIFEYPRGILIPPFINAHTHIPETLIRGICDNEDLNVWLYDHVWKVEPHLKEQDAFIGALLGIAEMIRSGTIGFLDQFYFSDKIAQAVDQTGVKALLAPSIFEGNAESGTIEKAFEVNKSVFEKWNGYENRIFIGFGPHAPYSINEEMFKTIIATTKQLETFIHTHLNEVENRVNQAYELWGMSPIEKMAEWGALQHTYAAHCIHVSSRDIELLKKNETTILHTLQSNLKLGSGIAPIPKFIGNNLNVCLGTDGNASNNNLDLLEEIRLVSLIHKGIQQNPKLINSLTALKMGSTNASKIFPNQSYTGKLAKNNPADFIVVSMDGAHNTPVIDPLSNLVFSSNSMDIVLTVSNGRILYQNGIFKTLNIEEILVKAQKSTDDLIDRAEYIPDNS